jgi:hypothetical protein
MDADLAAVTKLIEPEAKALGLDLVRVAMIGGAARHAPADDRRLH